MILIWLDCLRFAPSWKLFFPDQAAGASAVLSLTRSRLRGELARIVLSGWGPPLEWIYGGVASIGDMLAPPGAIPITKLVSARWILMPTRSGHNDANLSTYRWKCPNRAADDFRAKPYRQPSIVACAFPTPYFFDEKLHGMLVAMRHSEFWERMDHHLGASYAQVWADTQVISDLGSRTPSEALDQGASPKDVWRAVHARLELPTSQR